MREGEERGGEGGTRGKEREGGREGESGEQSEKGYRRVLASNGSVLFSIYSAKFRTK